MHHDVGWEIPECGYLRVSSLIRALRVTLRSRKIAPGDFFLLVLKHEGNMPFENDGLRGGVKEATVNYIIYSRFR